MFLTVLKMTRDSILSSNNVLNLNSTNSVHKWLLEQQDTHRVDGKILYKILETKNDIFVYIQSKDKFNVSNIEDRGFVFVKEVTLPMVTNGNMYDFDLQTCPNYTKDDKRCFIIDPNQRLSWVQEQFRKHGIILYTCTEYKNAPITVDKDKKQKVPTTSYRGKFYVENQDLAQEFIENGMGRLKNYGCGLILYK